MSSRDLQSSTTRATVLLFDPITWVDKWSYRIEESALAALNVELVNPPDRTFRDSLLEIADVVVVSSVDQLTSDHIERLERCVGILCYSAGMDAVDLDAAESVGIPVRNIRAGTDDVADHAMTLLLMAWRDIPSTTAAAESGAWDHAAHPEWRLIPGLRGRQLGIFGPGAIGRAVAQRARAFGMTTVATYRRPETADRDLPHRSLEELFSSSDAVVLTSSLNSTTRGAINRDVLSHAEGLVLVNVSRGAVIHEPDLVWALDTGHVAFAALDVRDSEPPDPAADLLTGRPDAISTPHTAGLTASALVATHHLAIEEISKFLAEADLI